MPISTTKARLELEAAKALTWYNDHYLMVNPDKIPVADDQPTE